MRRPPARYVAALFIAACLAPGSAAAQSSCTAYARLMQSTVEDARASNCRAIINQWDKGYHGHLLHCRSVSLPKARATLQSLGPVLSDCNRKHIFAVCRAYALSMSALQGRLLGLCTKRKLGGFSTSTKVEYEQDCLMHSYGSADWFQQRVGQMQERVDACR